MRPLSPAMAHAAFVFAALAAPAAAQPDADKAAPVPTRDIETPADRFGFMEGAQLQVSSGTENDQFTFRVALPTAPSVASRFSLSVSTPLQGDDDQMPSSLNALANGTRATLSWGYFDVRVGRPDEAVRRLRDRARRRCEAAEPDPEDPAQDRCMDSAYAMNRYDPANVRFEQSRSGPGATDYGIEASIGFNDFDWIDPVTLLPQEERRTDWSIAAHVAHYLAGSQTAFTGSISYQRAYEAAEEQTICPAGSTDPADCITAHGAAPSRDENALVAVGLRHRFGRGAQLDNLAIAPVVTYEAIDDVWGVDVPIYFIPDADGGLTGGIRFGYRSDRDDEFSIGVFAGLAFDILQ